MGGGRGGRGSAGLETRRLKNRLNPTRVKKKERTKLVQQKIFQPGKVLAICLKNIYKLVNVTSLITKQLYKTNSSLFLTFLLTKQIEENLQTLTYFECGQF